MIDQVEKTKAEDCLAGGGEMGALMRSLDWSKTLVGPVSSWPQSLRTAVSIILASRFPMLIHWGSEYVQFYNDGFRPILGANKHPGALGQPAYPWWTEIWDLLTPMFERVMAGEGTWYEDQVVFPNRYGYIEETYFTFSHSPIRDESGCVVGIFQAVTETTERVLSERRLRTLHDLATHTATAQVTEDACRIAIEILSQNSADIPFALLYLLNESRTQAHLAGTAGLEPDTSASPLVIDLNEQEKPGSWPIARVAHTGESAQVDLVEEFGSLPGGPWPESPSIAWVLPVAQPGIMLPTALLVVGASPRLALNDTYHRFFTLVAGQVATAIANTRALEQERKRAEALAELDRAKSQFLANMSHELRTPLNGILGYAQILKKSKANTEHQKNGLNIIHQCGEHLLNLINDVLDISKIEARKMELHPKNIHFSEFLEGIAEICRIRAEQKGIELAYETLTPIPKAIRADEKRLRQVLINLLGNAVKFTEKGIIRFKVGYQQEKFRFQVEDTGIGIAQEQLEEIFLPFQQVGKKSSETEGTGLGLTISRQLVELMGGELKVKSVLNQGTIFWFDLDLTEIDEWNDFSEHWERNIIGFKGKKRKVLVVDDQWANRSVLVNFLEPLGFEVVEAVNGLEGFNKACEFKPNLIFMDLVMPVMDGFEATRRLRKDPDLADVRVIAISASVFDFNQQQSQEVGCDDFLPKPFRERDLFDKLQVHLCLEWVYEEGTPVLGLDALPKQASSALMVSPPMAEVTVLLDLAMRGDLRGVADQAAKLETLDQQWGPFAIHLRQLAKGFKGKQIREFLKNYQRQE